jgi:hypothetical protein
MPNEEGRRTDDTRMLIKTLAFYVHRGYPLEWHEPPVRGSKGTAHDSRRDISFTVQDPRAFDAIRWELIKAELRRPPPRTSD